MSREPSSESIPKDKVVRIFDLMEQFAGYGFNKSHSAAYALLAYHTAYLKTHYPVEFMAALLSSEISKPENVVKYIKECREMGIAVEPPDVQISGADFTPSSNGIRFGLTAIKNVGRNAIDSIIAAREAERRFRHLLGVLREGGSALDEQTRSGVADQKRERSIPLAAGPSSSPLPTGRWSGRSRRSAICLLASMGSLPAWPPFSKAGVNGHKSNDDLPNTPDWDENERLQAEKEVLGFFVSGHPLDKYAEKLRNLNVVDTATALEMKAPPPARRRSGGGEPENLLAIAGVIVGLKVGKSKRSGEMYAQAALEDTVGKIDIICFPKDYARLCESLKIEVPVLVKGVLRADDDESAPKLSVSSVQPLEDIKIKLPQNVRIRVSLGECERSHAGLAAGYDHGRAWSRPAHDQPGKPRRILRHAGARGAYRRCRQRLHRTRRAAAGPGRRTSLRITRTTLSPWMAEFFRSLLLCLPPIPNLQTDKLTKPL